jgi:hypothetical protein
MERAWARHFETVPVEYFSLFKKSMAIVTIPYDFDQLQEPYAVVPICIEDTDRDGFLIDSGWFSAVVPVANPLRTLASKVLDDIWRVSELTEASVHALWYKHRHNLGCSPSARILAHAKWTAKDLRAGGRNPRRGVDVELLDSVRRKLYVAHDLQRHVEALEIREALARHFHAKGVPHIDQMLDMWLHGQEWNEIADRIGKRPKAATQDFWRWFNRALRKLDLL